MLSSPGCMTHILTVVANFSKEIYIVFFSLFLRKIKLLFYCILSLKHWTPQDWLDLSNLFRMSGFDMLTDQMQELIFLRNMPSIFVKFNIIYMYTQQFVYWVIIFYKIFYFACDTQNIMSYQKRYDFFSWCQYHTSSLWSFQ